MPFGGGVGKIFRVGKVPMNGQIGADYNAKKPDGGPDWQLRMMLVLMSPPGDIDVAPAVVRRRFQSAICNPQFK